MNTRTLITAFAFVSLVAPLAAQADTPSGDINTVFAIDQSVKSNAPQFDRRAHGNYIEVILASSTLSKPAPVTREQVREELAKMPQERVGA